MVKVLFSVVILFGGYAYWQYFKGTNPLRWFTVIPKADWIRYGVPILGGYTIVFFSVSYLNMIFMTHETQFLSFLTHPLTAILFRVFIPILLQASFITEFAVIFAAAGLIDLPIAIALIFGGNIGTCVTNTVVSFKIQKRNYCVRHTSSDIASKDQGDSNR